MTKLADERQAEVGAARCRWCGRKVADAGGRGRPRVYCRQSCRQAAHMARKLATAHGLSEGDVIVARDALDDVQGRLYCLQAALEDIDRDLAASSTAADVADALRWLVDNARPLADVWIEPRTTDLS